MTTLTDGRGLGGATTKHVSLAVLMPLGTLLTTEARRCTAYVSASDVQFESGRKPVLS